MLALSMVAGEKIQQIYSTQYGSFKSYKMYKSALRASIVHLI